MSDDNRIAVLACPTRDELHAFACAQLSESELVAIANHLAACPSCESLVASLSPDDPRIVAAVASAHLWDPVFNHPVLRQLCTIGRSTLVPPDRGSIDGEEQAPTTDRPRGTDGADGAEISAPPITQVWPQFGRSVVGRSKDSQEDVLPEKIGDYFVIKQLGSGGFGNVYLAKDPHRDRLVALKVPRQGRFSDDFLKEARTVATLDHPHILPVYDWVRTATGECFVVMKYVDGRSLESAMVNGRFTYERIATIFIAVSAALHYAHGQGFVHRDVKPANILLDRDGVPYVTDFGLAIHDSNQRQHRDEYAGTRPYMSPEQIRGEADQLDGRCDVWAVGAVLYELLSGRRPFGGGRDDLEYNILNRAPKPLRQIDDSIPAELERICLRCLSKSVSDRYSTAQDVANELRNWLTSVTPVAQPTSLATKGRHRGRLAILGLALCGAVVVGIAGYQNRGAHFGIAVATNENNTLVPADVAPAKTWRAMFDQPLGGFAVLQGDESDFLQQDTDRNTLTLRSERNLWVYATRYGGRPPLRIRGSVYVDDWMGCVGFCWGIPNDPLAAPRKTPACMALLIERYDPREPLLLSLKRLAVEDFIPGVPWVNDVKVLAQTNLNTPLKQFHALEVAVQESGVEVQIDGNVVWQPQTADHKLFREFVSARGAIGIAGRGKTVSFRDASLMVQDLTIGEKR